MSDVLHVSWRGKPVETLTREELLQALKDAMRPSKTQPDLEWLENEFHDLSATVEGEFAVGKDEHAACEANRKKASEIINQMRELLK